MTQIKKILVKYSIYVLDAVLAVSILAVLGVGILTHNYTQSLQKEKQAVSGQLKSVQAALNKIQNQDQYKRNESLQKEIDSIHHTYADTVSAYERIQDLKAQKQETGDMDKLLTTALSQLSEKNYASAQATLKDLDGQINQKTVVAVSPPRAENQTQNAPVSNSAPGEGFSVQQVQSPAGTYTVSVVAADLNSTRVVVDTASDNDCTNDCPVLPLATYVSRSGAYAGINGTFFCPTEYPQCAGKTNSFDTLLMNKNKHYFNSENNKYSVVPLVYFTGNTMGVRTRTLDWGRDTGVDSVIAMQPIYVVNRQNVFGGSTDPKITNKGTRCFIAAKGNMVYIGVIYSASASDAAAVLATMGMDNALGLDQGGSTALWANGGYKAGPGRNIPNAVLFVKK